MVDASAIGTTFAPTHAARRTGPAALFFDTLGETKPVHRDADAAEAAGLAGPADPADLPLLSGDDRRRRAVRDCSRRSEIDLARILHGEQTFVYRAPA